MKKRLFEILEMAPAGDIPSKIFDIFIILIILINVVTVMLETVSSLNYYIHIFHMVETVSVILFTMEYILRLWSCTSERKYSQPILGRLKYALIPLTIVDLIAIVPFFIPMLIVVDLRFVRILRLFRVFRLFKMVRYVEELRRFGNIMYNKKEDLFLGIFAITILLIFTSSVIYVLEHETQPEAFSSIPASMWWGVATLTTVGYGDVYPVTPLGRLFGAIVAILGIGLFAIPAGILASAYIEEIQTMKEPNICPHCKEEL